MTWEEKLAALQALDSGAHVRMRKPGDWYVSWRPNVREDHFLVGEYGNGNSPQAAVESHWDKITNLPADKWLVFDNYTGRRSVRWNGFMWQDVEAFVPKGAEA